MPEVIIHDDESFERALKRFKKKCEKAGILSDLRKHRHFEKPSEKRKRKMNAAVRKNRRGPRVPRASVAEALRAAMNAARKAQDKDRTLVLGTILANLQEPRDRAAASRHRRRSASMCCGRASRPAASRSSSTPRPAGPTWRRWSWPRSGCSRNSCRRRSIRRRSAPRSRAAIAGGAKDIGKVMGQVLPKFKGRADGKVINQIVREELQAG